MLLGRVYIEVVYHILKTALNLLLPNRAVFFNPVRPKGKKLIAGHKLNGE